MNKYFRRITFTIAMVVFLCIMIWAVAVMTGWYDKNEDDKDDDMKLTDFQKDFLLHLSWRPGHGDVFQNVVFSITGLYPASNSHILARRALEWEQIVEYEKGWVSLLPKGEKLVKELKEQGYSLPREKRMVEYRLRSDNPGRIRRIEEG